MKTAIFGLVMLQAGLLALEVYLWVSTGTPVAVAGAVFVAIMLGLTVISWLLIESYR